MIGLLQAVPVNPGPVFSFGVPSALFSADPFQAGNFAIGYAVHPDGKRFLMLHPVGSAARGGPELILVENLAVELQGRAQPR